MILLSDVERAAIVRILRGTGETGKEKTHL